jgi:hypothetical protein
MPEPRYGVLNLIEIGLACTVVSSDYHARKQRSTAVSGTHLLSVVHKYILECTGEELSADMIVYVMCPVVGA